MLHCAAGGDSREARLEQRHSHSRTCSISSGDAAARAPSSRLDKMKNSTRLLTRTTALYLACAIAASGPGFGQAQRGRASREPVTLNFVNADIEAVARTMAAIT